MRESCRACDAGLGPTRARKPPGPSIPQIDRVTWRFDASLSVKLWEATSMKLLRIYSQGVLIRSTCNFDLCLYCFFHLDCTLCF